MSGPNIYDTLDWKQFETPQALLDAQANAQAESTDALQLCREIEAKHKIRSLLDLRERERKGGRLSPTEKDILKESDAKFKRHSENEDAKRGSKKAVEDFAQATLCAGAVFETRSGERFLVGDTDPKTLNGDTGCGCCADDPDYSDIVRYAYLPGFETTETPGSDHAD